MEGEVGRVSDARLESYACFSPVTVLCNDDYSLQAERLSIVLEQLKRPVVQLRNIEIKVKNITEAQVTLKN